jgi:hypothetical protein
MSSLLGFNWMGESRRNVLKKGALVAVGAVATDTFVLGGMARRELEKWASDGQLDYDPVPTETLPDMIQPENPVVRDFAEETDIHPHRGISMPVEFEYATDRERWGRSGGGGRGGEEKGREKREGERDKGMESERE